MATTLSRMMKKAAASSLIPLASRTASPRNYTTAICTTTNLFRKVFSTTSIPTHHHFSALADNRSNSRDTLLSLIESEINCNEKKLHKIVEASREFAFKIEENAEKISITLTREYQGERIKVTVREPSFYYDHKTDEEQCVSLNVSVLNKSGLTFKIYVAADIYGIEIEDFDVENPNASGEDVGYCERPGFWTMDKKLQKAFYTYLEVRGIDHNTGKLLRGYFGQIKYQRYNAVSMKNLKKFLAN